MPKLALATLPLLAALATAQTAPATGPTFDVVSVIVVGQPTAGFTIPNGMTNGRFAASAMPVSFLLTLAFDVPPNAPRSQLLPGIPDWANTTFVAIDARASGEVSTEQFRQMLRNMLADRFQIKYHVESREAESRALRVAPGGAKLTPTSVPCAPATDPPVPGQAACGFSRSASRLEAPSADTTPPAIMPMQATFAAHSVTMAEFASYIGQHVQPGTELLDETGIQGKFDFTLSYPISMRRVSADSPPPPTPLSSEPVITFEDVLKSKLGLVIVKPRTSRQIPVINSLRPPTAN